MKPIVIIAIAVVCSVVAVLGVLFVIQQIEINEMNRQRILDGKLILCNSIIVSSNPFNMNSQNQAEIEYEICFTNAINEYGNDEQKIQWELSKKQKEVELQKNRKKLVEFENYCKEKWLGQLIEFRNCMETAQRIIQTHYTTP